MDDARPTPKQPEHTPTPRSTAPGDAVERILDHGDHFLSTGLRRSRSAIASGDPADLLAVLSFLADGSFAVAEVSRRMRRGARATHAAPSATTESSDAGLRHLRGGGEQQSRRGA